MSKYLFRAKSVQTNNWIYGAYLKMLPYTPYPTEKDIPEHKYKHLIIREGFSDWGMPRDLEAFAVQVDTVGQCTGIKDITGLYIYEGDIVIERNITGRAESYTTLVKDNESLYKDGDFEFEIIGNKFENPEKLKECSNV